jgi:hypothetical protein
MACGNQLAGRCAEARAEQPVGRRRRAAALNMAELGHARHDAGQRGRIPVSLTCQAGDPVDSPVTWASAPADAAAVARDVSDRADGVSGLVDPALAPTGAVAAGDRRSVKRGCARSAPEARGRSG